MKSFYGFLMSVALLGVFAATPVTFAKPVAAEKQQVFVRFERTVALHGALLNGDYVIVHDSALMEEGKPCFFVYTLEKGEPGQFVTTFHCERVAREKTKELKIRYHGAGYNASTPIVMEIQFAGDTEGHFISHERHH